MDNNELLQNTARIHTTEMGFDRIRRNLQLDLSNEEVLEFCVNGILDDSAKIERRGKNWYVETKGAVITVNAHSFTVITAHKRTK